MNLNKRFAIVISFSLVCGFLSGCSAGPRYDVILRGGTIYDGSGDTPYVGDLAIEGDMIAALGDIGDARARARD